MRKNRVIGWFAVRPLAWLTGAAVLVCTGGCPIDEDAVITETTHAALTAAVESLVDALAQYLAGT